MRSNGLNLIVVLFVTGLLAQTQLAQSTNEMQGCGFNPRMSLEITSAKPEYLQLETIEINAVFSNKTNEIVSTLNPYLVVDAAVIVDTGEHERTFRDLTQFRPLLRRVQAHIRPGETVNSTLLLSYNLPEMFPSPGSYLVRVALPASASGSFGIISNPLAITIKEPEGIDKKAYDFIMRNWAHRYYPVLFSWDPEFKTEDGRTILEEFVQRYSQSIYGERAILELGRYYLAHNEAEKARLQFEKITLSKDPTIANEAKKLYDVRNLPNR